MMAIPGRVAKRKLSDQVADGIKHWLMTANLRPGDRLPQERELMALLGVSRGTMREALKALEVQGLVRVSAGRSGGASIAEVSYDTAAGLLGNYFYFQDLSAEQVYDLRRLVEPEMASSVVGLLTQTDLARLDQLIVSCANVDETPDARRRQRLDELEFHNVLALRAPNPMIGFICRFINKVLADRVVYKRMYLEKLHKIDQENHRAHTELVKAYSQGNRVRVHDIMSRHMAECACHVADLEATVATRFLSDLSVNWLSDAMP